MARKSEVPITPSRLEAFSDAVMAVIITITALEIKPPDEGTLDALHQMLPTLMAYVLGFVFIGIYWNNHHHLLRSAKQINGAVMWANLHLLFWLSLVPASITWVGEHPKGVWPAVVFGCVAFMAGIAYYIMSRILIHVDESNKLRRHLGRDTKGIISQILYALGVGLAFINPGLAYITYAATSVMWLVPDRRLPASRKRPERL